MIIYKTFWILYKLKKNTLLNENIKKKTVPLIGTLQAFQEQIRVLQSKINSRTERIKLIIQRGSPISDPLLN